MAAAWQVNRMGGMGNQGPLSGGKSGKSGRFPYGE